MKIKTLLCSAPLTRHSLLVLGIGIASTAALTPGCSASGSGENDSPVTGDGDGDDDIDLGDGDGDNIIVDIPVADCEMDCDDFPADPFVDEESSAPVTEAEMALFGSDINAFADGSLCVTEPTLGTEVSPGSLYPVNWLRPRFKWMGGAGDTVYEVRIQAEEQRHDLVAYTKNTSFKIPHDIWEEVAKNSGSPLTVTIRGAGGGTITGMRGTIQVAPVNADGTMVFWATTTKKISKEGSYLSSFAVGSESVVRALDLNQLIQQTEIEITPGVGSSVEQGMTWEDGASLRGETYDANRPGHDPGEVQCIGCHVSTPDGSSVIFGDDWPWNKVAANVDPEAGEIGAKPTWLTEAGEAMLRMPFQSTPTMTESQWTEGRRMMVTSLANLASGKLFTKEGLGNSGSWLGGGTLVWMNLASTVPINPYRGSTDPWSAASARESALIAEKGNSWGVIELLGETYDSPVTPDWSHDGSLIAYSATNAADNGHPSKTNSSIPSDIHMVPFNDGAGGQVVELQGANDPNAKEYYPAFSQDDKWVAFNRASAGAPYYNIGSEIAVVSAEGGTPIRLRANDPPACTGETSPGINNSWAKWSPNVISHDGKSYYFLIFSSARRHDGQFILTDPWGESPDQNSAQLYMAAMVVDDNTGEVTDYPAVYLWNQNLFVEDNTENTYMSSNLTPAWDNFKIPEPPVIVR